MRYTDVSLHSFGFALPPRVVSSAALEDALAPLYQRLKLSAGRLEMISGVNAHIFRAATICIVYELYCEEFLEQCGDPKFLRWCMWIMSRNIMFLSEFSSVRGIRNADLRLIEFLRVMAFQQNGSRPEGAFSVDWPLSQQLLAELVNVSRPYLSERIGRLQAEGVLKITGNTFAVTARGERPVQ